MRMNVPPELIGYLGYDCPRVIDIVLTHSIDNGATAGTFCPDTLGVEIGRFQSVVYEYDDGTQEDDLIAASRDELIFALIHEITHVGQFISVDGNVDRYNKTFFVGEYEEHKGEIEADCMAENAPERIRLAVGNMIDKLI